MKKTWATYLKTLKENIALPEEQEPWTLRENKIIMKHFPSGNLEDLLEMLPGRTFKDIIWRANHLGVTRNNAHSKNVTPYDLINELAEDILFTN